MRLSVLPLLVVLVAGCASPKATFQVEVINHTDIPLSVGLTKQGHRGIRPAVEEGWAAPEDIAIHAAPLSERRWGRLLRPGERIVFGPQTGSFPAGIHASLRVYGGDRPIAELLGFLRDQDPDRVDVLLWPGFSRYVIERRENRLEAVRTGGE